MPFDCISKLEVCVVSPWTCLNGTGFVGLKLAQPVVLSVVW